MSGSTAAPASFTNCIVTDAGVVVMVLAVMTSFDAGVMPPAIGTHRMEAKIKCCHASLKLNW
jgi:hypothetical protein